jgi:hypothetical protein
MKTIKVPIHTENDNIYLEVVAEVDLVSNEEEAHPDDIAPVIEHYYSVSIQSIKLYFGIFPVSIEPSHLLDEAREEVIKAILIYVDEYFADQDED